MVTGFERSTRVRIPKNDAKTYHDFVTRDPAFEASDKSLAVVVHRKGQPEDAMDVDENAHAILAAWEGFPAVSYADDERVSVAMHGHISNAPEIRELYGLPPAEPATVGVDPTTPDNTHGPRRSRRISGNKATMDAAANDTNNNANNNNNNNNNNNVPQIEGARLVLELYQRRFEDKDGDPSDQPVTALTACEGSFSFVLVDKDRDAILIARSCESDTHPLFWGTAPGNPDGEDWDGSMLIAHTIESIDELCGGAAVAFPLGAFYYVDASMDYGVIQRMVTSAPKRKVKPLHRVNSSGQVCGLGFYTESGQNLASLHSKFIA